MIFMDFPKKVDFDRKKVSNLNFQKFTEYSLRMIFMDFHKTIYFELKKSQI